MGKYSIIGPGYQGRSLNVNASRCINFYPELNPQDSKSVGSLVGTPGLLLYIDTLLGPIRGMHYFNNLIYFVSANKLYSVDSAKNIFPVLNNIGAHVTLSTSDGRVEMADNGIYGGASNQLAFVDEQNIYCINITTKVLTSAAVPAKTIAFISGYFMADMGDAKFGISALYDGSLPWAALAFSTADAYPDNLQCVINNHNEAWLIGEYSTEIWVPDGSSNPLPFSRMTVIDYGTVAPHSVAKGNNTIFWLVSERNGTSGEIFGIGMANGYGVQIVTPQSINYHFSKYTKVMDAWGYCYTDRGHEFYVLTFPSENATWVYDATTNLCHERSRYTGDPYKINRHIGNAYAYAWGKHFIGSFLDGKIYEMSEKYYSDNGDPIASVRISPPIDDDDKILFFNKLQLDAETGVGDTRIEPYTDFTTQVGANPFGITVGFSHIWVAIETAGTIIKINPLTRAVVSTITPGLGFAGSGITCDDNYVWVCDSNNNTVLKINPNTDAIENIISVGVGPIGIIAKDNFLWVANNIDATLSKIDTTLDSVISVIPVGIDPLMICYDFNHVWVACAGSDEVWKIDPITDVVIANIATGVMPMMPAAGFNFIWTANQGGTISKIDPVTELMVHDFAVPAICECLVCSKSAIWASGGGLSLYKINPITYAIEAILTALPDPLDIALYVTEESKESLWITGISGDYITSLFLNIDLSSVNPQALLSWSNDGGHTWSNDHPTNMGKMGQYLTRMIWRRLGASRNRSFRIAITAAVKRVLIGSCLDYERGEY